ncbi:MAG: hypothetical protein ABJG41_09835 [Cyclobacteriaceae bacterium]
MRKLFFVLAVLAVSSLAPSCAGSDEEMIYPDMLDVPAPTEDDENDTNGPKGGG